MKAGAVKILALIRPPLASTCITVCSSGNGSWTPKVHVLSMNSAWVLWYGPSKLTPPSSIWLFRSPKFFSLSSPVT